MFSENFYVIFLFSFFRQVALSPICRYCPFICHTIAQNTFYVQLVVLSDFNSLQRKYECFVRCAKIGIQNPFFGRK